MQFVYTCLFDQHDFIYVAAAISLCILGSYLAVRLFSRALRARGSEKPVWVALAGFVGGSVIWTTHFLAMLGYTGGGQAGYEPVVTLLSLLISVLTCTAGFGIAAFADGSRLVEAGGVIMGLGIAAMHYTGMAAYTVPGTIIWREEYVVASVLFGAVFGALTTNKVVRPRNRFCKYTGALALVSGIVTTHFIAMSAVEVVLSPDIPVDDNMLSPAILGISVLGIMIALLALAACTYLLDASTNQAAVARYRHLSLHDALTGLPNRAALQEELLELERISPNLPGQIAILSFDLNRFKEINDVHGHAAGDAVIRTVGARLATAIGPDEFVARVGGDEFVAITRRYYGRMEGTSLSQRLLAEINKPIDWKESVFCVSSSVGISVYDRTAASLDEVIAQADVAMYRGKVSGPNSVCFYDPSMDQAVRERNALAMDLRSALVNGEFELHYQVQNDAETREVVGFEVLLRWNHPQRKKVSPAEFIPIAERTGLIIEIGEWVLREACSKAAGWRRPFSIAVNVAAQQLADMTFPSKIEQILEETGLPAHRLELEITESGIIGDQQRALLIIQQLKEIGVRIAMDDYGTGYSSLSTLMSFPFDKIKIDRSFVDKVDTNNQSAAIVRSTLILAQSLNIPVLAEGVETMKHWDFLRREGCAQVQGFLFGKPVPLEDIEALVNGCEQERVA
ncbi:bifunctional diguanylate cyclase/phosphodiesterase [Rhizobium sp. 0TCS1.26]|uniref:putative bifunctional diguanylate cyclase/phosphodiesterase n=1 Tax=Rhizobium sp. 0TCS1.26 TaxID=3142623 RepID=UPI003D2BD067